MVTSMPVTPHRNVAMVCNDGMTSSVCSLSSCAGIDAANMTGVSQPNQGTTPLISDGSNADQTKTKESVFTMTNTNIIAVEVLNTMTVKALKEHAAVIGAKLPSKAVKATIITNIILKQASMMPRNVMAVDPIVAASEASGPSVSEVINDDEDFFDADVDAVVSPKFIEFVSADNIKVEFIRDGRRHIVGWSKKDFKMHLFTATGDRFTSDKLVSYVTIIKSFKELVNGVHGDVARVVNALVRIKAMPAQIKVLERKSKVSNSGQNVSGHVNQDVRRHRGTVDAELMNAFVSTYADAFGISESEVRNKHARQIMAFNKAYSTADVSDTSAFIMEYVVGVINELAVAGE